MELNPYIHFNGNCEEAFNLYAKTLGGKILFKMTYAEAPSEDQRFPEFKDKIMHATLQIGEQRIMGSDAPPQYYSKPQGLYVSINVTDVAESERIYNVLAENANIQMPLGKTFWAERFGMFTDRFGVPWMINCEGAKEQQGAA
jgi:PhnB protein